MRRGRGGLWSDPRLLDSGPFGRNHAGHGHVARRIPCGADDLPGDGGLAYFTQESADAPPFQPSKRWERPRCYAPIKRAR